MWKFTIILNLQIRKSAKKIDKLPEGLSRDEYFNMVNVDAPDHYFKSELVISWLKKHLKE